MRLFEACDALGLSAEFVFRLFRVGLRSAQGGIRRFEVCFNLRELTRNQIEIGLQGLMVAREGFQRGRCLRRFCTGEIPLVERLRRALVAPFPFRRLEQRLIQTGRRLRQARAFRIGGRFGGRFCSRFCSRFGSRFGGGFGGVVGGRFGGRFGSRFGGRFGGRFGFGLRGLFDFGHYVGIEVGELEERARRFGRLVEVSGRHGRRDLNVGRDNLAKEPSFGRFAPAHPRFGVHHGAQLFRGATELAAIERNERFLHAVQHVGLMAQVVCVAFHARPRVVDHHKRAFFHDDRIACARDNAGHARGNADHVGANLRGRILNRIRNREASDNRTAGRVDFDFGIFARLERLEPILDGLRANQLAPFAVVVERRDFRVELERFHFCYSPLPG